MDRPRRATFLRLLMLLLGVFTSISANNARAQNCSVGKRCGNACISRNDVCHIGTSDSSPTTANTVTLVGLGVFALAGTSSGLAQGQDGNDWLAGLSIAIVVGGEILIIRLADLARSESGQDATPQVKAFSVLNALILVWDLLILTSVTVDNDQRMAGLLGWDSVAGWSLGVPDVQIEPGFAGSREILSLRF